MSDDPLADVGEYDAPPNMGAIKRDIACYVLDLANEYDLTELNKLELYIYLLKKVYEQIDECRHQLEKERF
jgi:hypothetical protein